AGLVTGVRTCAFPISHVLLPGSAAVRGGAGPFRCADTAIDALLARLLSKGARPPDLVAKMAGGARMFASYGNGSGGIGGQNVLRERTSVVQGIGAAGD